MNSQEMLIALKDRGFHTSVVSAATSIPYFRLDKCKNGTQELKETDYKLLVKFYESNMVAKNE